MLVDEIQAVALLHNPIGAEHLPNNPVIFEKRLFLL